MKKLQIIGIILFLISSFFFLGCKKEDPEPEIKNYTITYHANLPPAGQFKVIKYAVSGHIYTDTLTHTNQFSLTLNRQSGDILSLEADCNITTTNETVYVSIIVDGVTTSYESISGTGNQNAYCYYKLP